MKNGEKVLIKTTKLETKKPSYIKELKAEQMAVRCLNIIRAREARLIEVRRAVLRKQIVRKIQKLIVDKLVINPIRILQISVNDTLKKEKRLRIRHHYPYS